MNAFSIQENKLLNDWQRDFPLQARPFEVIAERVGMPHIETIQSYEELAKRGVISRIGAVIATGVLGASTLAAMAVPQDRLESVAEQVSAHRGVNHNYERTHRFNLWFVVTAADQASLKAILADIEAETNIKVMSLPMLQPYHIDLGFDLNGTSSRPASNNPCRSEPVSCPVDKQLLWALETGLKFTEQPYDAIARDLHMSADDVLMRIARLCKSGVIKRFGVVVRHLELGYKSNAMVVWNIPDERLETVADVLCSAPYVTLCYKRPRHLPDWPYNLFSMIHGQDREQVLEQIKSLSQHPELDGIDYDVLFSTRRFKQIGARYSPVSPNREIA